MQDRWSVLNAIQMLASDVRGPGMVIISAMMPMRLGLGLIFVGRMLGNALSAKLGLRRMEDVHTCTVRDVITTSVGASW